MENNYQNNNLSSQKPSIWVANQHLKTLLLILVFVFLGSSIFLLVLQQVQMVYRQKIYNDAVAGLPKHQISQTASSTGLSDIAGWKTYKNDQYGFEFQYPSALYAMDDIKNFITTSFGQAVIVSLYNIQDAQETQKCHCGEVQRFQVWSVTNPDKLSLDAYAQKYYPSDVSNIQHVSVANLDATDAVEFGEMSRYILIQNNSLIFQIIPVNDILATFKFTPKP